MQRRIIMTLVCVGSLLGLYQALFHHPNTPSSEIEVEAIEQKAQPNLESATQSNSDPVEKVVAFHPPRSASEPDSPLDPDTKEFLSLVGRATTHEQIYEHPSSHVVAIEDDGHWIAQEDLLVDEKNLVKGIGNSDVRIAKLENIQLWPRNTVPYRIDLALNPEPIRKAIEMINRLTTVRFVEQTTETDFIQFRFTDRRQCLSYVGRRGGEQNIILDPNTCGSGNVLHEIMHALGFIHEHSRSDRDEHLIVHWNEIIADARSQFQKMTPALSRIDLHPFDFDSILLYASDSFSAQQRPTLTRKDGSAFKANREQLSKGDVARIKILYPPSANHHEH